MSHMKGRKITLATSSVSKRVIGPGKRAYRKLAGLYDNGPSGACDVIRLVLLAAVENCQGVAAGESKLESAVFVSRHLFYLRTQQTESRRCGMWCPRVPI